MFLEFHCFLTLTPLCSRDTGFLLQCAVYFQLHLLLSAQNSPPTIATFALVILISVKITSSGELIGYTELIIKNMYILLFIDYYYFCCISFAPETFYDTLLYAYISQMFLRLVVKYSPTHHQWAPVVTGLTGLPRCIRFLPFHVSVPLSFPGFPGIISETKSF